MSTPSRRLGRRVLLAASTALALRPFGAMAQNNRVPRVGFLGANTAAAAGHLAAAFAARLAELGWIDGSTVVIEYRWAGGQTARFTEIAAGFAAAGVDVIVTSGNAPAVAARAATRTIPIVLASSADILAAHLVDSLARPGGNVTGLTFAPEDTVGKRLELLRELVPELRRVGVLFNPDANPEQVASLRSAAAPGLAIALEDLAFRGPGDLERVPAAPPGAAIQALFVVSDPLVFVHRVAINAFALRRLLPTVHMLQEYVDDGGLVSYGPNFVDFFRRSAEIVDRILRGARPAELPIERPMIFRMVVNLRTARALGLAIPPALLARADEVIE